MVYKRGCRHDINLFKALAKLDSTQFLQPIATILSKDLPYTAYRYTLELLSLWYMPTVLFILGWRLYFYANENKEPVHIHGEKGDMECKYWILFDEMDIKEEFAYNMSPKDKREVRKIIFQNFDLIIDSWNNFFKSSI